jgi:hypothetical protein
MTSAVEHDFDVGPHGISGYYDVMLGRLRAATPKIVFAAAAWLWILSWPPHTVIFRIGPVLSLGSVTKLALFAWTVWACLPLFPAFLAWARWRGLERAGLKTGIRNDHRLRLVHFDSRTGQSIFENTTQQRRVEEARSVAHRRRAIHRNLPDRSAT